MASGKQLSFAHGEVSPSYRYKSSTVAYNEGLHKLRNGFPRVGGGVSNRSGFKFVSGLTAIGSTPKGIQSNTKLFFQKRKEHLGEDLSKKHSGDIYFSFINTTVGKEGIGFTIYNLFSDFTSRASRPIYNTKSDYLAQSNLISFEDDAYITLRDKGILRFPYERLFDPRSGETLLNISGQYMPADESRVHVEVVSDYFYRRPNPAGDSTSRTSYRPILWIRPEAKVQKYNEGIQSVYIISEQESQGIERIVCAYQGTATSFQGEPIVFQLVDGLRFPTSTASTAAAYANIINNRERGVLAITRAGGTTLSSGVDGSIRPVGTVRNFADNFVLAEKFNSFRPEGRRVYRLYRAFSLGQSASLIDTVHVDFSELNRLSGLESFITLRDASSTGGVTSRSFSDGLRLYGGVNNDAIDTQFFNYDQVDYNFIGGGHRLYVPAVNSSTVGQTTRFVPFVRVRELMRYQQRTFASYIDRGPLDAENTLRSVIGVSKINSKHNFSTAPVVNPANAFEFNIPLGDVSPVVAMLGADRPMIFTLNNVYMLLGTDSGIITPTEINPTVIYTGGCSETVRPVLVDNRAFFLNNDHTSLVMIAFNASGGRGVQVIETDQMAKHFLEMNITQIAVTKSFETIIWLLTSEGDLISVTVHSNGTFGFALHTLTDGFIENITAARYPYIYHPTIKNNAWTTPDVEVLAATIVREGNRTLEIMAGRDDRQSENMGFMDGQVTFGTRLTANSDGYNVDLERPRGRFEPIYLPEISTDVSNDLDEIFDRLKTTLDGETNWPHYTYPTTQPIPEITTFDAKLQYFKTPTVIDRYPFARQWTVGKGYDTNKGIEHQQRINVIKNRDDDYYTVEFTATHSLISFIPARLTASKVFPGQPQEFIPSFILIYLDILQRYVRGRYNQDLTPNQRALANKIINEGWYLNFKSPEIIRYNTGDSHVVLRKVSTEDEFTHPGYLDLSAYGTTAQYSKNSVNQGGATTVAGYANLNNIVTARIPRPNLKRDSFSGFPVRNYLVKAQYAIEGNDTIPEAFLDVENNLDVSFDNKFRITTNWSTMNNKVVNLPHHLRNKKVAVFADNEVVSSPLSEKPTVAEKALTVNSVGTLYLPHYYQWGIVGLPYKFEMETLQIETQDDKALISGRKMINKLNVALNRTREGARSSSIRGFEYNEKVDTSYPIIKENVRDESIDKKNGTFSGVVESVLSSGWSEGGRVRITNADPTPITVNAIYPKGIESGD